MTPNDIVTPTLKNPLGAQEPSDASSEAIKPYEEAVLEGQSLRERPRTAAGPIQIGRQHAKDRMTVWERIDVLRDPGSEPTILYQNFMEAAR